MWATSQGDRTLVGDEAWLVLNSVGYLHDMITSGVDYGEPYQTEVAMFSALQPTQQMAILHEVAHGLLDDQTPLVELTAVREATVYAIYRELASLVQIELDMSRLNGEPDYFFRDAIVCACNQFSESPSEWADGFSLNDPTSYEPPDRECVQFEAWTQAVEFLADQILWDRDFELESAFADHDPAKVKAIKQYMGINEDYFAVAAPDANSKQYRKLHLELVGLTRSLQGNPDEPYEPDNDILF